MKDDFVRRSDVEAVVHSWIERNQYSKKVDELDLSLQRIPSADVRANYHSKWVKVVNPKDQSVLYYACHHCKKRVFVDSPDNLESVSFCPFCGAFMG